MASSEVEMNELLRLSQKTVDCRQRYNNKLSHLEKYQTVQRKFTKAGRDSGSCICWQRLINNNCQLLPKMIEMRLCNSIYIYIYS